MPRGRKAATAAAADEQTADDLGVERLEDGDALSEELRSRPNIAGATLRPPPRPGQIGPNVPMMVRATEPGHYGSLRDVGAVFEIMSHGFSPNWMERVEE